MPPTSQTQQPHIPVLEAICSGDAREMGVAQGQQLRSKVREAMSVLTNLEAFRLQKPNWMAMNVYRAMAEQKARRFLSRGLVGGLPEARDRLLGLAGGAGVRPRGVFLLNAMEAVLSELSRSTVVPIAAACSALAVSGSSSSTGDPMVAHNFDYLPVVRPLYTLRESRPTGRLRSLEFTAAPLSGTIDGINEAGLCITNNYAYTTDARQPGPTISMLIAETLGRCRTVPEASAFLARSQRWGAGLLMMGDADGRIAALEISSTRSELRSPAGGANRLFHTNRAQSQTLAEVEVDNAAVYSSRAPRALRGRRVHQSAEARAERFRRRLAGVDRLAPDDISQVMADHGVEDAPSADTICMHSDYWHTTACIQFFPKQRTMRVAYDNACQAEFVGFQL